MSTPGPIRLCEYPWVVVRLACEGCKRRGAYRLARLAGKFGAEAELDHVLDRLASDCIARGHKVKLKRTSAAERDFPTSTAGRRPTRPICRPECLDRVGESFDRAVADLLELSRRKKAAQQR